MLRWMLRPDARLALAGIGVAAALLIPLAGTLALSSLRPESQPDDGWVLVRPDGQPIRLADIPAPDRAVRLERGADRLLAAYVVGTPMVTANESWPMPHAPATETLGLRMKAQAARAQDLVPTAATLVHPRHLADNATADAVLAKAPALRDRLVAAGLVAHPVDGAHTFVAESVAQVRGASVALTVASIPVVALIAMAFAELDAAEMSRTAAVVAALGHPGRARALLVGRVVSVVLLAALAAALVAAALYLFGASFHPTPMPWRSLALAIGAPTAAAVAFGAWRSAAGVRKAGGLLRAPSTEISPSRLLPRIPPLAQPMLMGTRILPAIALAGLLFVVDVGFPLAVAGVPQALTGEAGELVRTDHAGSLLSGRTDARAAELARFDEAVTAASAEVLVPTVVLGAPLLLRGGDWGGLASFHGLRMAEGTPPGPGEVALGTGLAARLGLAVGDKVAVPGSSRPIVRHFEVSGLVEGDVLLESEAILTLADAQDLAGLGPRVATVVRARPDTQAALDALSRTGSDVRVTSLSITPQEPVVGTIATAHVSLANLGPAAGSRLLFVRVDGEAVAQLDARVPGFTTTTLQASFVVPRAGFTLEVNPTLEVDARDSALALSAPALQFDGGPVRVTATANGAPAAGVQVVLYRDAAAAQAGTPRVASTETADNGTAIFRNVPPGLYVAAAAQGAATDVRVASAANATVGRLVVERVWLQPSNPAPGQVTTVYARLVNLGGVQANGTVPIRLDGGIIGLPAVTLAPGGATTVSAQAAPDAGTHTVSALDRSVGFQTSSRGGTAAAGGGSLAVARRSDTLARSAADEALGNARSVLLGLGGTALVSSLALVYLAVARTVHHRRGIFPTLWSLGMDPDRIRRRASLEATLMGFGAALAASALGALLFGLAGAIQWPLAFGHTVPQPVSLTFALQAAAAFAVACGAATYLTLGRLVDEEHLHRPGADTRPPLDPVTVPQVLGEAP